MKIFHENGYIRSCEKHLIEENKKYWENKTNITDDSQWIYVFHSVGETFEVCVREDIIAKGLQAQTKLPIVAISCENKMKANDELDRSFGIQHVFTVNVEKFTNLFSRIRTRLHAWYFSISTYNKKEKLFQIKYRGITCGEAIHDTILRNAPFNPKCSSTFNFDCFDVNRSIYFEYIRYALSMIDQTKKLFRRRKPAYVVTAERIYTPGLFMEIASAEGAEVLLAHMIFTNIVERIAPKKLTQEFKYADLWANLIESYLKRENLKKENMQNYFVDKTRKVDKLNLLAALGITNTRKNVFILPHCFSDDVRKSCRHTFYNDYNEWFVDTLRIVKEIKNVNWIVKDHPHAAFHRQDDYVKKIFAEYQSENLYWCSKEISGMNIKDVADCVITCSGDAGIEFWSYGIPTITVSGAYYCLSGISYNMKSRSEYEETLRHIDVLEKPSVESVKLAQKYLMTVKQMMHCSEEPLGRLLEEIYGQRMECLKDGDIGTAPLFSFCKWYRSILEKGYIEESAIYQLKNVFDVA